MSAGAVVATPPPPSPTGPDAPGTPGTPGVAKALASAALDSARRVVPTADFLRSSEVARVEALSALERSASAVQGRCADDSGVSVCLRRRVVAEGTVDAGALGPEVPSHPVGGSAADAATASAAVASEVLDHHSQVCEGTGTDGYRVRPVYAYTGAVPNPAVVQIISDSLANVDQAFSESAERTGGSRRVRWVTNNGASGCRVVLRTARITTGSTDFDALMADLQAQGAVPAVGVGTVKHIVWTEGEILQPSSPGGPRPSTCGLGESYHDDDPLGTDDPNDNLYGTRAAVDDRCWDINGGGSVPAHELMHTLGAVQPTAPNYANDGHCDDEYDLMCYGPGMRYVCPSTADQARFDCGNDDYFNTDPTVGQYLCDHWNTADSAYLRGWDVVQPPRAVVGLTVTASPGAVRVSHSGTASCFGASHYRVEIVGARSVNTTSLSLTLASPAGDHVIRVTPHSPYGDVYGAAVSVNVTVPPPTPTPKPTPKPPPAPKPNRAPVGRMVLSLTDGRGYGMLAWAIDPDTGGPTRMRVVIPGVVNREYGWNYRWADMPKVTGWNRREALVFLASCLPGSTRCASTRRMRTPVLGTASTVVPTR
ncbi:MAG: hypothetical protein M5U19_21955 [Microthrixaceae bacterium]|nr:hypothetical protein [Microthrixaceae bacterium]